MNIERLYEDTRSVTPVVSTILVVAIVVILAATIGATTLGYTEDISEPPAQALLELEFEEADVDGRNSGELLWQIKLTHTGGDDVNGEDIMVYFSHGEVEVTGEYDETLSSGDSVEVAIVHTYGYGDESQYDCDTDENVACSLAGYSGNYPTEDHVELVMVHEPSDTILHEEEIDISGNYGIYKDEDDRSDDSLTFS